MRVSISAAIQEREDADPFFCIRVGGVQPKLVKFVGGSFDRIEPDVAFFGLSEFAAIGFGEEGAGEGEGLAAGFATDEFRAGGDVAPLVASAHLKFAIFMRIEPIKIISLDQLIREFGEAHAAFTFEATLNAVLCRHVIYRNMFPDVADKIEEVHVAKPVIIVNH